MTSLFPVYLNFKNKYVYCTCSHKIAKRLAKKPKYIETILRTQINNLIKIKFLYVMKL